MTQGLRSLVFRVRTIETTGGPLPLRGLSLDDILGLFYRHREGVTSIFEEVLEAAGKSPEDISTLALKLTVTVPAIVAETIALAAGADPSDAEAFFGDVGIARKLTLAEQAEALEAIAQQTFTSEMPPGKLIALLLQAVQAGRSAAPSLPEN